MRSKINIFGTETTIDRNVDVIVTNDIRNMLGITNDRDIVITYNEEPRSLTRKSKGMNGVHTNNTSPTFRIDVESSEIPEEDLGMVTAPHVKNTYPLFRDAEIGVSLYPLKQSRRRSLTLRIRHKSKAYIVSLRDKMTLMSMQYTQIRYHKLEYYFGIHESVIYMLNHFLELKNKELEEEDRLELIPYLNKYSLDGFNTVVANKEYPYKSEIVYRESVSNVIGRINKTLYEIQESKDDDYYTLEFDYELWYEKPIMLIAEYPIMIYNNPINYHYTKLYSHPDRYVPKYGKSGKVWKGAYYISNQINKVHIDQRNFLVYPIFDNRLKIQNYNHYLTLAQVLIRVNNDYDVTNVFNIPCIYFKKSFRDYIKRFHNDNVKLFEGLFLFELYRNGERVDNIKLSLDEEGNLTTDLPLRKYFTYHLVIRILTDLNYLPIDKRNELLNFFKETYIDRTEEIDKVYTGNPFYNKDKKYYVDEFGNLVDEEGYVCYIDGERIIDEETGLPILGGKKLGIFNGDVEECIYIDSEGNFVNPDGLVIDEEGNVILDENGNPIEPGPPSYIWVEDDKYDGPYIESEYLRKQNKHHDKILDNHYGVNIKKIKENLYDSCLAEDWLDMFDIPGSDGIRYNRKEVFNLLTQVTSLRPSYPKTVNMFTSQVFRKG